jgi:hypothetical protein
MRLYVGVRERFPQKAVGAIRGDGTVVDMPRNTVWLKNVGWRGTKSQVNCVGGAGAIARVSELHSGYPGLD